MKKLHGIFAWLDEQNSTRRGKLINQLVPIVVCTLLFIFFMVSSHFFMTELINPTLNEKIQIKVIWLDVLVGFFLYFVTAVDYALIVGRMQITNPGAKARLVMNIMTCVGCYVGVSLVLFLWGFAKEIALLIIPILIFAGSVMVKLAYEGAEYYEHDKAIPAWARIGTAKIVTGLYYIARVFTFWMPELGKPSVQKMPLLELAKWSFLLPFIIGLDDLVGYMGAMTIYNVFSLLMGIYIADILIDILIFVSPDITKKVVESPLLSLIAAYAFLYLAYKSYSESFITLHEVFHLPSWEVALGVVLFVLGVVFVDLVVARFVRKKYMPEVTDKRH